MMLLPLALLTLVGGEPTASPPTQPPPAGVDRYLPPAVVRLRHLEVMECLLSILSGEQMGPGTAWFHPGQGRYGWKWLAARYGTDRDGAITRKQFTGPAALFDRLDRDGDGAITAADFDWSDDSPYVRQLQLAALLLRRADGDGDGKLSPAEWEALFRRAARGQESLAPEDLRRMLFPPTPRRTGGGPPPDMPTPAILLAGLRAGEIGSPAEGPAVGARAPDFTLPSVDKKKLVTLSKIYPRKPVVLIFGSFT